MEQTLPYPRDDAPAATSKDRSVAKSDAATDAALDSVSSVAVTINRPRGELYRYWRNFANLPTFMENIVAIEPIDERRSHWIVEAPGGGTVEWTARVTEDVPDRLIAWESEDGADVPNSGRIAFTDASGDRGTVVTATIAYDPPAGVVGKVIAKIFQREPAIQSRRELRRFKQLMEAGEIATNATNRKQFAEEKD